jgi:hypothetical protein
MLTKARREITEKVRLMPDLFTDEYEEAKKRWEIARTAYDEAVRLYEEIHRLLKFEAKELEVAQKLFTAQQLKVIKAAKNPTLRNVKKEG